MNHLENILKASSIISLQSDLMIKKHDEYLNFIEPKFNKKFPDWEYRYEYENMYSIDVQKWLKSQRRKFDKKFTYCFYLINENDEILDDNLEFNDCILGVQDKYALFQDVEELHNYSYKKIGIITFINN